MKLIVFAPAEIEDKFKLVLQADPDDIKPTFFTYDSFDDIVAFLGQKQAEFDTALFSGKTAMIYTGKRITPTIPWEYPLRDGSDLLQVLLQIVLSKKYSILNLSIDLINQSLVLNILDEIGIDNTKTHNYFIQNYSYDKNFINLLVAFHEQNYFYKDASCCITGFHSVQKELSHRNIPCFLLKPTVGAIRQIVNKIKLQQKITLSKQSQIVAIAVQIDQPKEYSILTEDSYQYIIDRTNITREVYTFAQRIEAAVVEAGVREYLLFSTRYVLEKYTNNYEAIELLNLVSHNTAGTVSLGIGYGNTAQAAKINARLGMQKAANYGNTAYLVYADKKIMGPLGTNNNSITDKRNELIDANFQKISEKTCISIDTLFQLHTFCQKRNQLQFTSSELAEGLDITRRSANRILNKLLLREYCFEVGKRIAGKSGRPERILQLNFNE